MRQIPTSFGKEQESGFTFTSSRSRSEIEMGKVVTPCLPGLGSTRMTLVLFKSSSASDTKSKARNVKRMLSMPVNQSVFTAFVADGATDASHVNGDASDAIVYDAVHLATTRAIQTCWLNNK